jgi:hypothetical protein
MKRREFLAALKNTLLTFSFGRLLSGCAVIERGAYRSRHMAFFLGYLVYGAPPPSEEVGKIQDLLHAAVQNASGLQARIERINFDIVLKSLPASFEKAPAEDRKSISNSMLPVLLEHPEIMNVLYQYVDEQSALKVIDYPELPGQFGECGWLVLEGEVWERYYGR